MKLPENVKITMVDDITKTIHGVRWLGVYRWTSGEKDVYEQYTAPYPPSHHIDDFQDRKKRLLIEMTKKLYGR